MPSLVGSEMCIRDRASSPGNLSRARQFPWKASRTFPWWLNCAGKVAKIGNCFRARPCKKEMKPKTEKKQRKQVTGSPPTKPGGISFVVHPIQKATKHLGTKHPPIPAFPRDIICAPGFASLECTYDTLKCTGTATIPKKNGAKYSVKGTYCLLYTSPSPRD